MMGRRQHYGLTKRSNDADFSPRHGGLPDVGDVGASRRRTAADGRRRNAARVVREVYVSARSAVGRESRGHRSGRGVAMDRLELRAIEYDADGEPRLYRVGPPTPAKVLTWTDGDICVCGVKCAK